MQWSFGFILFPKCRKFWVKLCLDRLKTVHEYLRLLRVKIIVLKENDWHCVCVLTWQVICMAVRNSNILFGWHCLLFKRKKKNTKSCQEWKVTWINFVFLIHRTSVCKSTCSGFSLLWKNRNYEDIRILPSFDKATRHWIHQNLLGHCGFKTSATNIHQQSFTSHPVVEYRSKTITVQVFCA